MTDPLALFDGPRFLSRAGVHAAVVSGYAVLTVLLTWPLIIHLTTHIPVNPDIRPPSLFGDHWVYLWLLWIINRLPMDAHGLSFFTTLIFYPRGTDLTLPILFGSGLPLATSRPFVSLLGVIPAYNLLMLISLALTAYATFLLVRHLTTHSAAAFISGVIFAFSPFYLARTLGHFNFVVSSLWIPLYILFFIRATEDGHLRHAITASLILTLAAANPYYFVFLLVFSAAYSLYLVYRHPNRPLPIKLFTRLLSIGAGTLLFSLPIAWLALNSEWKNVLIGIPLSDWRTFGADLLAFFTPSTYHPVWGSLVKPLYDNFASNITEQTVYVGYIVLALSFLGILKAPKDESRFWSLAAGIFFVLSLGPFLHINGQHLFGPAWMNVSLPLPYLAVAFIPGLGFMRVSSRFSIMLMLALAVLAGYGAKCLFTRLEGRRPLEILAFAFLTLGIAAEFLSAPLPLVDARPPRIYETLTAKNRTGGTLLDIPLDWRIFKHEYYQTAHQKRLLLGQAPRLALSTDAQYADTLPFIKLFKQPHLITDYHNSPINPLDVTRFIEFFDLRAITLHKNYISADVFEQLKRFLLKHFPVSHIEEDAQIAMLVLATDTASPQMWEKESFLLDFGTSAPQFALLEGWSEPERWVPGLTVAWAAARESTLWLYFPAVRPFTMELRLAPFSFPSSPQQQVKVFVNGKFLTMIPLDQTDWKTYSVTVPASHLKKGINSFRFVYRYTATPAKVLPGSQDERHLAVAFDFIALHPAEEK